METWQEVTDLKTSIIRHFQEEVGASYDFRDIIDNLDDDEVLYSIISWAKNNRVRIFNDKICRFFLQQQGEENKRYHGLAHGKRKEPYHCGYSRKA